MGILGHFDYDKARSIVKRLLDPLPSGSYLALNDGTNIINEKFAQAQETYIRSGASPTTCAARSRSPASSRTWSLIALYTAVIAIGTVVLGDNPSTLAGVVMAFLAAVPAVAFLLAGPLRQVQREGVERQVLLQSASAAFFATMSAALAYGLLEAFAGLSPLSAWWLYGLGMGSWAVVSLVLGRRLR